MVLTASTVAPLVVGAHGRNGGAYADNGAHSHNEEPQNQPKSYPNFDGFPHDML